jgi:signal transduction histidine kinase
MKQTPMPSIRSKVTVGYYGLAAGVALVAALAYGDLRFLEDRIGEGVAVSAFKEDTLEMRRYEKNFFLYHEPVDAAAALEHARGAAERLSETQTVLADVAAVSELDAITAALARYRALMEGFHASGTAGPGTQLEQEVRATGRAISDTAEVLAERERLALASATQRAQRALLASLLLVSLLGILAGHLLSRAVVRPLRELEGALDPVAKGRFREIQVTSRDREVLSFVGAFNRMLEEIEMRRRQLLHSEKLASLGVLVSGVAHELNNPLANVSSSCQLLQEELDSAGRDQLREWLAQIDGETERARRIVRTLLDFARQRPFEPVPVAVEDVVERTRVLLRSRLREGVELRVDVPPGLTVRGDAQRLQQVLINLIENAVSAGGAGTRVRVSARCADWASTAPAHDAPLLGEPGCGLGPRQPLAYITVEDTGAGIPAEILPRVFDPFFTTRDTGQGMGLGLYVVQEIIDEHGGCVAVQSPPGGGTRFLIWLPCSRPET